MVLVFYYMVWIWFYFNTLIWHFIAVLACTLLFGCFINGFGVCYYGCGYNVVLYNFGIINYGYHIY